MGRKKWENLSKEEKKKFKQKIIKKMDELTNMKERFNEEYDFFEAVTDEAKDTFECNLDCTDCGINDIKKCVQNFRVANIYLLKLLKLDMASLHMFMEGLDSYMKALFQILKYQTDGVEEPEESDEGDTIVQNYYS